MTDDNTQRAIGRLEGQMQEVISLLKSQDERASASRSRMYEAQEKTTLEVHDLSNRVEGVEEAIKIMSPVVKQVEKLKERAWGILIVLLFVWAIVGGLILDGVTWVAQMIAKAFMGGP